MKLRHYIYSVMLSVLITTLTSAPVSASDLAEIYSQAKQHDPQFLSSTATYRANQEIGNQSSGDWYPKINLTGQVTDNSQTVTSSGSTSKYDLENKSYALKLTQPLFNADKWAQLDVASAQVKQAEAVYTDAKQALVLRAAEGYFNLLSAQDDLTFSTAERKAIKEQLYLIQQRFNVGLIAITDVHEAQARYDLSESNYIIAENSVNIEKEKLRELTGQLPGDISTLKAETPLLNPEPNDIQAWVETALKSNASLMAAENAQRAALAQISKQQAGHYPQLDLVAQHAYSDVGNSFFPGRETEDNSLSLQMSMSLFEGGVVNSRTRQARYEHQARQYDFEKSKRAAEREARSAYLNVISSISTVKALAQATLSNEKRLEATQAGFEVGTRTAVDVLNAQQELFDARRNHANARYIYILQTLRLKSAAGILADNDIQLINNWLQ